MLPLHNDRLKAKWLNTTLNRYDLTKKNRITPKCCKTTDSKKGGPHSRPFGYTQQI